MTNARIITWLILLGCTILSVVGSKFIFTEYLQVLSPSELEARTVSEVFASSEAGDTTSLTINQVKRGIYELGIEFPDQNWPVGQSFQGSVDVEVHKDGQKVTSFDASEFTRRYYADDRLFYRKIVLADIELPTADNTKEVKLVVSLIRVDSNITQYPEAKLFVRPSPIK